MKYKPGNILLLNNNKTVYVFSVDEETKTYQVVDTENEGEVFSVSEGSVSILVT